MPCNCQDCRPARKCRCGNYVSQGSRCQECEDILADRAWEERKDRYDDAD